MKQFLNEEKINQLIKLIEDNEIERAEKLAWEWVKTGTFNRISFNKLLRIFPSENKETIDQWQDSRKNAIDALERPLGFSDGEAREFARIRFEEQEKQGKKK